MVIGGQWLTHNWLLVVFVKASWRSRVANHLFHSKTEYVCLWHSLWCMKSDCQGLLTHLPADTH